MNTDYYQYLLHVSWPALSGLFVIYVFFGFRLFQAIKIYRLHRPRAAGADYALAIRLIFTFVVVISYTNMFVSSYSDWFHQPKVFRGIVQTLPPANLTSNEKPIMVIRTGEESIQVKVDQSSLSNIKEQDTVEVVYLSQKMDVIRCTILTRQAEYNI